MKKKIITGLAMALSLVFTACSDNGSNHGPDSGSPAKTASKNEISKLVYDDLAQDFEQKYVYANFNSVYQSYRVIYLNYDKSDDSDFGQRTGDQKKIVVGLFNPKDGEFKSGKYTWEGDENGMNRISVQVETADGLKGCNYAGIDNPGFVEITEIDKEKIVGSFHVYGQGFEISGTFNTKNEPVN